MELHQAVERQLAQTGGEDYDPALTIVLAQARSGVLCLSLQALEGTGITGVRAGRNDLRRHPGTGEVITLAAAAAGPPLAEPPPAPEDSDLFRDAPAFCQAYRAAASKTDRTRSVHTVMASTGPTASPQVQRWLGQGGVRAPSADGQRRPGVPRRPWFASQINRMPRPSGGGSGTSTASRARWPA